MAYQRSRTSSSSSLFSIPTSHKVTGEKGNFLMSHYDSPALENSSLTRSLRARISTQRRNTIFKLANTYKMFPEKPINIEKIREIIQRNLHDLETLAYDPKKSRDLSKSLSNGILQEIKMLGIARYKFVCVVTIGQLKSQSLRVASRCVWDEDTDTFVSESYHNETLFAVGTVYGVYHE